MKKGIVSNLSWKFAERISAQLVTLIVSIILARILEPEHYGIVSIVMIFITLANVFVSDGFGSALIQKKNADQLDFTSVLIFNVFFSVLIYAILYFFAPVITHFYGEDYEILTPVLRVLGLRLIPAAINSVQQAYISKKMMFQKFFLSTLLGTIMSGITGVIMAYMGFGVWAIVAQYLTNTIVGTIVLTIVIGKYPKINFSFTRIKTLFGYGSRVLSTSLLITGYMEIKAIIIGKVYTTSDLAFYDKGRQFPNLISTNITSSISAVLFPQMSNQQDDMTVIKEITRKSIRFSSYIMCPIMLGMVAISRQFVLILLTEKWLPCVVLMQFFCIIYLFQPIHSANMQAIKAIGRSDVYLKIEIIKKVIELIGLILVMNISVLAIVVSMSIMTTLFTFINAYPNSKLLNYSFIEQIKDISPAFILSLMMFGIVQSICFLPIDNQYLLIGSKIFVGIIVYLFLSIISRNNEYSTLINMLIKKKGKKE